MKHLILFESSKAPPQIAGKSFEVFVLENNQRVISIKSIQKGLGYEGKNENWLFEFLKGINIYMPISTELIDAYKKPIKIHNPNYNQKLYAIAESAFQGSLQLIVKAKDEGFLNINQIKFSKEAKLLLEDENSSNLRKLINNATGFTLFKENSLAKMILSLQNNDLAFVWMKTF